MGTVKTYFEQVPLSEVKKIAAKVIAKKEVAIIGKRRPGSDGRRSHVKTKRG